MKEKRPSQDSDLIEPLFWRPPPAINPTDQNLDRPKGLIFFALLGILSVITVLILAHSFLHARAAHKDTQHKPSADSVSIVTREGID
ncbi:MULTISPECIES: hypothetical protein [Xanthomonas]|uniref:Uncharacterized protein n=1 Tax=Xanthomonas sacchari TaxID=56458 RepID=A0AA46SPC3_9XANT|nr:MULTISPECIES: hypothetical protein [Xanthomonas]UYK87197.1 hypothetical protein NG824_11810 [Xanthomonas sacchari]